MPPERNFIGYANNPPCVPWPNDARLAISVVVNYEEGGEYSLLDGPRREVMGEVPSPVPPHLRDLYNESFFEYGSRVGVWRYLDMFKRFDVPVTFYACALPLERNPHVARAIVENGHEVCGHGYGWQEYHDMPIAEERESIRRTVESLQRTTGQRPLGWFTRSVCSPNTRDLVVEEGGFVYDSLTFNDDLPYYVPVQGKPWLVLPYSMELNDARFWRGGLVSVADFREYLISGFDTLYEESATIPKMLSVGLHCRIAGTPARSRAVADFLAYARSKPGVWFARRIDIARWWLEHQPPR